VSYFNKSLNKSPFSQSNLDRNDNKTFAYRKAESTPKPDEDPQAGIMNLMKKMYDEGDDDMKRTIAKAWTESREKQGPGMGDL